MCIVDGAGREDLISLSFCVFLLLLHYGNVICEKHGHAAHRIQTTQWGAGQNSILYVDVHRWLSLQFSVLFRMVTSYVAIEVSLLCPYRKGPVSGDGKQCQFNESKWKIAIIIIYWFASACCQMRKKREYNHENECHFILCQKRNLNECLCGLNDNILDEDMGNNADWPQILLLVRPSPSFHLVWPVFLQMKRPASIIWMAEHFEMAFECHSRYANCTGVLIILNFCIKLNHFPAL